MVVRRNREEKTNNNNHKKRREEMLPKGSLVCLCVQGRSVGREEYSARCAVECSAVQCRAVVLLAVVFFEK